jgi:CHAD domain-containing protein
MLTIYQSSELYQEIQTGNWTEETEIEKLHELRTLIQELDISTYLATMGASNCIFVEGHLPKDKAKMIQLLDRVIASVDEEELRRYRVNLRHL